MLTVAVTDVLVDSKGAPVAGRQVAVELVAGPIGGFAPDGSHIISTTYAITDGAGAWTVNLVPNGNVEPAGTFYRAHVGVDESLPFIVPAGVGAVSLRAVLIDEPTMPQPVVTGVQRPELEQAVAAALAEFGAATGAPGQPRYAGQGPPPALIVGASPNDVYLDITTGDLYRLT